ncbi:hypothetical protein Taro_055033 [Colocasia esculenta]|uniref:Leucine-rich repeat-containing N-terminal plant-type domain-containing protein n=1 Tax=Colocasia esculenta TaxID=4460 RepID=A0A843XRR0_COLES|nr:hypothetical protein [Colocasia esculenta]
MATNTHHHILLSAFHCLLLLGLVCLCNVVGGSNSTWSRPGGCIDSEREALLQFKRGLPHDPANRLSSWTADGSDCCGWNGVSCDSTSGHVVKLDLNSPETFWDEISRIQSYETYHNRSLRGVIGPSLLGLKYLAYLDLSNNDFEDKPIPEFMGSLSNLEYLNLSGANLHGRIPHHLGNLSRLQTLDLSNNDGDLLMGDDARWVSHLSSLQHLNLNLVDLSSDGSSCKLLLALNMLPSLSWVNLGSCGIKSIPSFPLVNLTSLSFLDLSKNEIQSPFPEWLTNITSLEHLDLSWNNFQGGIPSALWSMSSLTELIISGNGRLDGKLPGNQSSLCKLQMLEMIRMNISGDINKLEGSFSGCIRSSLQSLHLRDNQLSGSFPGWLMEMKQLKHLFLSSNSLQGPIPAFLGRLSFLETLDLSGNNLNGRIPHSLGDVSRLTILDLRSNHLQGVIPEFLGNVSSLRRLSLGENILSGGIPKSLGRLPSLESLYLGYNNLSGPIPAECLSNLSSLRYLDVSYNHLGGMVSAAHFSNLKSLQILSMANNPIIFNISTDWVPPFRLWYVDLSLCKVGPPFPTWLRLQQHVRILRLSNSGILDAIPDSYWSSTSSIDVLDLSNNQITGRLLDSLKHIVIRNLDIHSNRLEGAIPEDVGEAMPSLQMLIVSNNKLNGSIPRSLCQLQILDFLDLSQNNFSGDIPDCWKPSSYPKLEVLHLSHNSLVGVIPHSMGYLSSLQSLRLNGNSLSGELPQSLRNCSGMSILDLGENKISGNIPIWLPESMPYLKVLRLRSNNFKGDIPLNLSSLAYLQVIDLANNGLVGNIPHGFGNFSAMKFIHNINETIYWKNGSSASYYKEVIDVVMKGQMLQYERLLSLVVSIDLSNNRLSGGIPQDLADLVGLQNLNVSGNRLSGHIMKNINELHCLESLDLSRNNFAGEIPTVMLSMTSLSHLNLSFNNFSGRIPQGNQFNTFLDLSIYKGNPYLCGSPLDVPCEDGDKQEDHNNPDELEEHKNGNAMWIYVFTVLGFILGYWAVCGTLIMHNRWRTMFFIFIDGKFDQLYMFLILLMRRFKRLGKAI